MVDQPRLDSMLSNLKTYVEVLRRLAALPRAEFLADADKIASAKYHFIVAIECCIDIANHIIASERLRLPGTTGESFTVLVEHGFCPAALEPSLKAMTRFRNRLVHLYWQVDNELLADYLQNNLGDFEQFAVAIGKLS